MPYSLKDIRQETDFSLIGVSTDFHDYQLAYWLNKRLNMQLKKESKGLDVKNSNSKTTLVFPFFSYFDSYFGSELSLIGNRSSESSEMRQKKDLFFVPRIFFLIPEKKQFDYFLHLKGFSQTSIQHIEYEVKKIQGIFFAECINNKTLKSMTKTNLIF